MFEQLAPRDTQYQHELRWSQFHLRELWSVNIEALLICAGLNPSLL